MKTIEEGSRWHAIKGHAKLPSDDIRKALYTILSGFYASPHIHKIAAERFFAELTGLLDDVEQATLQEKMIYVAIRLRILDDYNTSLNHAPYKKDAATWNVGFIDDMKGSKVNLTLREACNKIIHAQLFNWKVFATSPVDKFGLAPQVVIYGTHGIKKWRCRIVIDKFVECSCFQLAYAPT
jgi:hypothetical protein